MSLKKKIVFSHHALQQMKERGTNKNEVKHTILQGEKIPAKRNRKGFRLNFTFNDTWGNKHYSTKQIMAIVAEEPNSLIVVTVYTFYF